MAAINFPTPSTVGEQFSANGQTWEWDGTSWKNVTAGYVGSRGYTGSAGTNGFTGSQGNTGSTGPTGFNFSL